MIRILSRTVEPVGGIYTPPFMRITDQRWITNTCIARSVLTCVQEPESILRRIKHYVTWLDER